MTNFENLMQEMKKDISLFFQIRGCINCPAMKGCEMSVRFHKSDSCKERFWDWANAEYTGEEAGE